MKAYAVLLSTSVAPEWSLEIWRYTEAFAMVEVEEILSLAALGDICARTLIIPVRVPFWVMDRDKYIRERWRNVGAVEGLHSQHCSGACEREEEWPRP